MSNRTPNALVHETSPYLLQHAYNPVFWYPWNEEALQKSEKEQKPILLSIGYSACHWCHVMERECFEDEEVAAIMNEHFICIKLDREERPEIDRLYMDAVQTITGSGGWPLNVFLTPEKKPFYGGTYFPKWSKYNRPGWMDVLQYFSDAWREKKELVVEQAEQLFKELNMQQDAMRKRIGVSDDVKVDFKSCRDKILQRADTLHGGFGTAPKFPQFGSISFLYTYGYFSKEPVALEHAVFSADALIHGGIFDHVGGGMARYSTDDAWLIPHFEKMLYDNALLIEALSDLYSITKENRYKNAIQKTIEFCNRELLSPEGLFYAALDADSEGEEGKYYVWTKDEISQTLGDKAEDFCCLVGVTDAGNFEGHNIISLPLKRQGNEQVDGYYNAELEAQFEKLLLLREKRVRPGLDDKQILSWNAMMNRALCKAFSALGEDKYRTMAIEHGKAISDIFGNEGRLRGRIHCKGATKGTPLLEDLAFSIRAFLNLQEITGNQAFLIQAEQWMMQAEKEYVNAQCEPYFNSVSTESDTMFSAVVQHDAEIPSANAVMAENLKKLGVLLDRKTWVQRSEEMQKGMAMQINSHPASYATWLKTDFHSHVGKMELVITGQAADQCLKKELALFQPHKVLQSSVNPVDLPLFVGKRFDENTWIYRCFEGFCSEPEKFLE